jgi:hypothetical protein
LVLVCASMRDERGSYRQGRDAEPLGELETGQAELQQRRARETYLRETLLRIPHCVSGGGEYFSRRGRVHATTQRIA